jgi:hypothetical protein
MHGFNQPSMLMATHNENQIENSADFYYFFSSLVIETLQNHFIFNFLFHFWMKFHQERKGCMGDDMK